MQLKATLFKRENCCFCSIFWSTRHLKHAFCQWRLDRKSLQF